MTLFLLISEQPEGPARGSEEEEPEFTHLKWEEHPAAKTSEGSFLKSPNMVLSFSYFQFSVSLHFFFFLCLICVFIHVNKNIPNW